MITATEATMKPPPVQKQPETPETSDWQEFRKKRTRDKILAAAEELFAEKTYAGTTTREIAKRAGVGIGTVFSHFPDKPSLAGALLGDQLEAAMERAKLPAPDGTEILDEILGICGGLYTAYAAQIDLSRALMAEALFGGSSETQRFKTSFKEMVALMEDRLADAQARGELPSRLDARISARGCYADYLMVLVASLQSGTLDVALMLRQMTLLLKERLALHAGDSTSHS
jgi:AcrR family transcriptional regulator